MKIDDSMLFLEWCFGGSKPDTEGFLLVLWRMLFVCVECSDIFAISTHEERKLRHKLRH